MLTARLPRETTMKIPYPMAKISAIRVEGFCTAFFRLFTRLRLVRYISALIASHHLS